MALMQCAALAMSASSYKICSSLDSIRLLSGTGSMLLPSQSNINKELLIRKYCPGVLMYNGSFILQPDLLLGYKDQ